MRRLFTRLMLVAVLASVVPTARAGAGDDVLYTVDVSHAGATALRALRAADGVRWWAELGDLLVVSGTKASKASAARRFDVATVDGPLPGERLFVTHHLHPSQLAARNISRPAGASPTRTLASSGVYALVAATPDAASALDGDEPGAVEPLQLNRSYARSSLNDPRPSTAKSASGSAYADAVDGVRWRATVEDLANFGTRFVGTPGNAAARDYLAAQLRALGLRVETPQFPVEGEAAYNVEAELRGTTRPNDVYVVCGHYDSISEQPTTRAPGAEDNGSGAAGVVELARVFAAHPPAATVRFVLFSGEEEGLYGSKDYVSRLAASGDASRVKAVVNMDMIAFSGDDDLDVLLETGTVGKDVVAALSSAAEGFTNLRVVTSYSPFGSDHVPFIRAGIPCVLTIENDWDSYAGYHTSRDTLENVRLDMGAQVLRMNAAAIGALASDRAAAPVVVTLTEPSAVNRLYGGFVESLAWTATGGDVASFDLDFSLDGGATFVSIASGLAPDVRRFNWTVPADLRSKSGVVRVTARLADGGAVSDISDERIRFKPAAGPEIRSVRFRASDGGELVLKGRFGAEFTRVYVNDSPLDATVTLARDLDGNTAVALTARDATLEALLPAGVRVRVRAVDERTGLSTPEFTFTR